MRMQLCRQILAAPLRHLEQLGNARLLTALTDDVPNITNAVLLIPLLCVNASLVIGCLIYLGILSWVGVLIVLVFMILGVATYQIPIIKVQKIFRAAREHGDKLQEHFRALTLGAKELKIHNERRVELSFEEHRFFDVRRWKQGLAYFNKPIHKVQITKNPDGTLTYGYPVWENRTFSEFQDLLPIPQSERDKNPKLTPNPGY